MGAVKERKLTDSTTTLTAVPLSSHAQRSRYTEEPHLTPVFYMLPA